MDKKIKLFFYDENKKLTKTHSIFRYKTTIDANKTLHMINYSDESNIIYYKRKDMNDIVLPQYILNKGVIMIKGVTEKQLEYSYNINNSIITGSLNLDKFVLEFVRVGGNRTNGPLHKNDDAYYEIKFIAIYV